MNASLCSIHVFTEFRGTKFQIFWLTEVQFLQELEVIIQRVVKLKKINKILAFCSIFIT